MYLTITEAYNIYQVLSKFVEQKLPIELSYKIMKIISSLETDINFYKDNVQKIIDQYAVKDEQGNIVFDEQKENVQIQSENIEDFNKEYQELNEMPIEIGDYTFSLNELGLLEATPKELYILELLIEPPEKNEEDEYYIEEENEEK